MTGRSSRIALVALAMFAPLTPAFAFLPAGRVEKPALDVRLPPTDAARAGWVMRAPTPAQLASGDALSAAIPDLTLRWDGMSGSPAWIAAPPGLALSAPFPGTPEVAARAFLHANSALFGLTPREVDRLRHASTIPGANGWSHVHFAQSVAGLDVFGAVVSVTLGPDNAAISAGGSLYGQLDLRFAPTVGAAEAVARAARDVYPDRVFTGVQLEASDGVDQRTVFDRAEFARPIEARLVVFPTQDGARLAWETRIGEPDLTTDYLLLVDATDAAIIYRRNLTLRAEARVLSTPSPVPSVEEYRPDLHDLFPIPASAGQSVGNWITAPGTRLLGNNATGIPRRESEPPLAEPSGSYDYPFNTPDSALVNAWWLANDAHDRYYALGFDEASRNFQQDNLGMGGLGGDPIRVVMAAGWPRNDALFTPITLDGTSSTIMMEWRDCSPCDDHDGYSGSDGDRTGAYDGSVLYHEYTHGVSTRLVGGGTSTTCLLGLQSGALGESWGDVMASAFTSVEGVGSYYFFHRGSLRSALHNLGYSDFCKVANAGCEVHGDGMIFAGALWDLRESLLALDPSTGPDTFQHLIVQGMKSTACTPSFLVARDALLSADTALYGSTHHRVIWNVFANRGMGQDATTTGDADTAPHAGYVVPPAHVCTPPATPTLTLAEPAGQNTIRLTYSAPGAATVEIWRDDLYNPIDSLQRIGYTTSTSEFTDSTVVGGRSYRYHLVALGPGGVSCRSAASGTAEAPAAGSCTAYPIFDPQLTVADGSPSCALTLSWSPASPGCPGSSVPIVYNVYRADEPGLEPFSRALIGRTAERTFQDTPPEDGRTSYYLVLAQHGTTDDPVDAHDRGSAQVVRWLPRVPTLGRTDVQSWDFESGTAGWTTDNTGDATGGWVLAAPRGNHYQGVWFAPPEAASGTTAWVTGDGPADAPIAAYDNDGTVSLISPTWDGTGGATIVSFDYWAHLGQLLVKIDNGVTTSTVVLSSYPTLVQVFDAAARFSWQRAELDVASYVTPTSTMSIHFVTVPDYILSEFGIDNVRVERAAVCGRSGLRVTSVTVADTQAGWGNGNGVLEPGETARLVATVVNDGTVTARAPVATLRSGASGLLVHDSTATLPDVSPGGSAATIGPGFTVTAPSDRACLDAMAFEFDIVDQAGTRALSPWTVEFGSAVTETIFADTFETDKGWSAPVGFVGHGKWQRGVPVGTMDDTHQANPATDSPNDAGSKCYVTENGAPGDPPGKNDVDRYQGLSPILQSPYLDFSGYKRVRLYYDLWYYDNSTNSPREDDATYQVTWGSWQTSWSLVDPTPGWITVETDLSFVTPLVPNNVITFAANDMGPDSVVEMGVDRVRVIGDRQVCNPLGITHPPNAVESSLMVTRSASSVDVIWGPPPIDASHDGAAYYQAWVSNQPRSDFDIERTTAGTSLVRSPLPFNEYYLITAVNAAGTSGDEPTP